MASSAGVRDKNILGPGAKSLGRGPDLSQLKSPILTSLSGTRQVIHALECGTGEVKQYLLDEVNLMYECKTCFSVFRSLANLIAHKRTFCKARYKDTHHVYRDKNLDGGPPPFSDDVQTIVIEAEPVECIAEEVKLDNYAPSVELLKTSGILQDISNKISNKPAVNRLLPPGKPGLGQIVNKLKAKIDGVEPSFYEHKERVGENANQVTNQVEKISSTQVVHLEPMYETDSGLMQSWRYSEDGETVGETYSAWQQAEADKKCYKVWPNGKVTSTQETIKLVTGPDGHVYSVRVPFDAFASVDDIDEEDEEQGYTKYPCPTCKKTYSKIMNVFNHMVKVHDIEMFEAKAKRKIIQNQSVYVEGTKRKSKTKDSFQRPVKPVLVKLKNYTLNSKVPVNLCDKLNTPGLSSCPILNTHCLSDSTIVEKRDLERAEELNRLVAERDEREKDDEDLPDEVYNKLMQYVNRRKIQCTINGETFSRPYLVRNHVANVHLKLKRWVCKHCDFGCWLKYQCVNHAISEHKYRSEESAKEGIKELSKAEYFDQNPNIHIDLIDPNREITPESEETKENGVDVESDPKHDDVNEAPEIIDINDEDDKEVSFKQNGSSPGASSPTSSPVEIVNENNRRKRGRPPKITRYDVKKPRPSSDERTSDNNDKSSLKIVFSKVAPPNSSSSVSPSESRESSVSRDTDYSDTSDLVTSSEAAKNSQFSTEGNKKSKTRR